MRVALTTTERLMWHCEHHTVELESAALERLISDYQHLVRAASSNNQKSNSPRQRKCDTARGPFPDFAHTGSPSTAKTRALREPTPNLRVPAPPSVNPPHPPRAFT